jgi:hypothetical protein
MQRTLTTILAVILTSLPAFAQTKVTGEKIVKSTINSSSIDSTPIGSNSRSSVSATWMLLTSAPLNPTLGNSMGLGWNATGLGEVDFVDDYGTGSGGFSWYMTGGSGTSHAWDSASPIMKLDRSGNLTATKFIGSVSGNVIGNVSGNSTTASAFANSPANCASTTPATGIQANGNANCGSYPSSLGLTSGYTTLPNGVIIQWTQGVSQSTSGATQIVNFPINFPHNCWSVQASALVPSPADAAVSFYQVVGWSANSVTVFLSRNADHAFQPTTPLIFAIGN